VNPFRLITLSLAVLLAACAGTRPDIKPTELARKPEPSKAEILRPVSFADVPGWQQDDVSAAWPAFLNSCRALARKAEWQSACADARAVEPQDKVAVRAYFQTRFMPYRVVNPNSTDTGLATGYYEPLLQGARRRGGRFQTPLRGVPDDLLTIDLSGVYPELKNMRLRGRLVGNKVLPYPARAELVGSGRVQGKELLWVDDPVEAFFLQVQGSGRVYFADKKQTVRVAYADQNGHPYRSIGRYLIDRGELSSDQASMQGIKAWYDANPARRDELLNANPSYVFFREEPIGDPSIGPKGALGVPLTPLRSIAVDPAFVPLGAPVFIATTEPNSDEPLRRLTMAQDTGGAIRGAVRADYFWGFGSEAGRLAGRMRQKAALWVLLPKQTAEIVPASLGGRK
jgi:membrane-bound lytic murein transglycosylase A